MSESGNWLAEAVVSFLSGPLYVSSGEGCGCATWRAHAGPDAVDGPQINPVMEYVDQHCLIFTPDEENKLEYTPVRLARCGMRAWHRHW